MSYTQLYDPVTPLEALSGANIAFRGLRKISTAEQFRLRNSLFEKFGKFSESPYPCRILNCTIP